MNSQTKSLALAWQMSLMMVLCAVVVMLPDLAFATASTNTAVGNALCNVVKWFTGTTGKAIATIAIIIIGVGALMGKVSWGMAMIVGLGVALIFGAASMVNSINSSAGTANTTSC